MTKRKPNKHRFLIGYIRDGNCVYDMEENEIKGRRWVNPLTLFQAKRIIKKLSSTECRKVIFELKPYIIVERGETL